MALYTKGYVPNAPSFMAWGGNQSISNTTMTVMALGTNNWDLGSKFDTSTYRFTPTVIGHYWFVANVQYTAQGATRSIMQLTKNSTPFSTVEAVQPDNTKTNIMAAGMVDLDADDYVTAQVYQDSGATLTTNNSSSMCFMMGFRVDFEAN